MIPLLIVAAILGNILGYFLGTITRGGLEKGKYIPKVRTEHLKKAEIFYTRYGVFAVLFARFVPVIRTVVPFFAGVVSMNRKTYTAWSIIGGIVWITIVTLVGYFFGKGFALQNVAFLGVGAVVAAVVATPVFLVVIKRFVK